VTPVATQEKWLSRCVATRALLCIMRDRQAVLELPELEQRLSNLQSQVERLWRKAEASVPPIEQRLATMADQYAEYLKRWAATVERHTNAVAQLEAYASEWKDASSRVRQETADRLHELETTIEREWDTLRRMQEQPIRELREQAESLTQVSLAMANASQQGVEKADARFAAFETEVHLRLNELTRELTSAVADMKARIDRLPPRDASAQWSLDDVTRLHGQLRDGARSPDQFPHTIEHASVAAPRELTSAASRGEPSAPAEPDRVSIAAPPPPQIWSGGPQRWAPAAAVVAVVVILASFFGWQMQREISRATERAVLAEQKANLAVTETTRQAEEQRQQSEKLNEETRALAQRMQLIGSVMAAPDLIRFNLSGGDGASGQALFSRSRGIVVSASRLPVPPPNGVYSTWLLTPTVPVKVGSLVVEGNGTLTLAGATPNVPRRVVGVMVSDEASESAEAPGVAVLSSVRPAAAEAPAQ
jgi:hypothetical protein